MRDETIGPAIALDWYDGPLLEIALVTFPDRDKLVQIVSLLCKITGEYPWQRATLRLSREDLQAMLDLLDDKPVADYHGEVIVQQPAKPES